MNVESIARICHEVNRAYCLSLGDNSQLPWEESPGWQKESVIQGVENIINDPSTTPEQSHLSWLRHKEADGWIWGPEKNPEKKEHPCMVAYKDLPEPQKVKDYLFGAVVRASLR